MLENTLNLDEQSTLDPSCSCRPYAASAAATPANGRLAKPPLGVLHAITGLAIGGAEIMLYRLLQGSDRRRFASTVLALMTPGAVGGRIAALNVPIVSLNMREGRPLAPSILSVGRIARAVAPDVVQGWMYHGNLTATLAWWHLKRRGPLVWSVHHSLADISCEKLSTRVAVRLNAALSRLPDAIIYCSRQGVRQHEAVGFAGNKSEVIPNGFDCDHSRPDPAGKARLCQMLGIEPDRIVVGMVTRAHPMKDHANLIRAVAALSDRPFGLHLVLLGRGVDAPDGKIAQTVREAGIGDRVTLLEEREDVRPILSGLDIAASPSAWGEAFPLIVGEAMASGVPCVVTDLGDCGWLVGDTGVVVPPRDTEALAAGLEHLVNLGPDGRRALGAAARRRILENFSLASVAQRYEALYQRLVANAPQGGRVGEPIIRPASDTLIGG
jgi:glycosyltransferase involved in cell wall biosynthesis